MSLWRNKMTENRLRHLRLLRLLRRAVFEMRPFLDLSVRDYDLVVPTQSPTTFFPARAW